MSSYQEQITRHTKRQEVQFEEEEQMSDQTRQKMLELPDQQFKTHMIVMLTFLKDKVDSMLKQMNNTSREIETLRKNQNEMLNVKNTVTDIKNAFDGFISS